MKIKTSKGQEFKTPDGYTYFGDVDGKLGFHVALVDGNVTVYFAGTELKLEGNDTVRIII